MSYRVAILDEPTARAVPTPALTLEIGQETVTVRELIRRRVYEECREYNAGLSQDGPHQSWRGLVTPEAAGRTPSGNPTGRGLDWEKQYARAVDAFGRMGFLVLLDERQAETPDETVTLCLDRPLEVTFIKGAEGGG